MAWIYPPRIVQWDITANCNLRCYHCRAGFVGKQVKDLDFKKVVSVLKKIKHLSPHATLALAGGEPLIRKDLKAILSCVKNLGIKVELLTNGTLISQENISWLCETIQGFNVSLEGATAEINDRIRGRGAFQKTVKGLNILLKNNAQVAVRMTYFHQGENEVERLMYFLAKLGINFFNFRYFVPVGKACGQKGLEAEQYKKLCQRIWFLGKKLNITVGFSDPFPEILINKTKQNEIKKDPPLIQGKAVTGCSAGFYLLYLNPQGIVQLCPYFPIFIADAKKENLNRVWFKNKRLNLFRCHRSILEGKCGVCEYKFACGGCRGAAWGATGDFLEEDPRCWKK